MIATIIVNPTPSLTENYLWIPETTDNVVPGLDSLFAYLQPKLCDIISITEFDNQQHAIINDGISNTYPNWN